MISLDFTPTQFCNLVRMHSLLWGRKNEAKLRQAESWPAAAISPIKVGQALFTLGRWCDDTENISQKKSLIILAP